MRVNLFRTSFFNRHPQAGFSLLELSIVLVIVAVMISAASTGADLYRQAVAVKIQNDFIQAWVRVWNDFYKLSGNVPPGDDRSDPTNFILKRKNTPLCNSETSKDLSNTILSTTLNQVTLPTGNSIVSPDLFVYQDKNGISHQLKVCWMTVDWSVQSGSVNRYVLKNAHVMLIEGLSPELALKLDVMYDDRIDARHGSFRQVSFADSFKPESRNWGKDASYDSSQYVEVRAYLLLNFS